VKSAVAKKQGGEKAMDGEFTMLDVQELVPSPTNPRKQFDREELQELAATIRAHGVLQPLRVRRPQRFAGEVGPVQFEIVCGARRFEAAILAGLEQVPCVVVDLTDDQVAEEQLIENVQREDLDPIEEAGGYQQLLDRGGTVEDLAARLGKSKGHVYARLKLLQVPEKLAAAVSKGDVSASVAELVGRIPNPKLREEAAKGILRGGFETWQQNKGEPLTYREAKEGIERRFVCELKQAPFSQKDESLLASAGACTACPKRAGNRPDEYPGARADMCMDPACYRLKVEAHQQRLKDRALAEGKTVLTGKEAEKALSYSSDYWLADTYAFGISQSGKTYGQLLGKSTEEIAVLAQDGHGNLRTLVPKDAAKKILKEKGLSLKGGRDLTPNEKKRRAEERARAEADRRCVGLVALRAERQAVMMTGWQTQHMDQTLRQITKALLGEVWADKRAEVCRRRELEIPETKNGRHAAIELALEQAIDRMDGPMLVGLLAELAAMRHVRNVWGTDKERKAFWSHFEVDPRAVEKEVRREKATGKKPAARARPQAEDLDEDLQDQDVHACRECGCTEDTPCEGGCWWVEDDLCSACVRAGHKPKTADGKRRWKETQQAGSAAMAGAP
jgi:ParB/RepB/Spo0J family partition protein